MSGEKERVDDYLSTIARLEPDISIIDASAFYASAAISLKRIADHLEAKDAAIQQFNKRITKRRLVRLSDWFYVRLATFD